MADQNMIDQLRQMNQLKSQVGDAQAQQQMFANTMGDSQSLLSTPGYTTNIGGHQASMPGIQQVNYGDIIGRGVSNYLSAKAGKTARTKQEAYDDLNSQYMQNVLGDDPKAQQLYYGAKSGIPGMGDALAKHLAPQKEAMGAFLQYLQSESPDPDVAAQVAPKFGVNPDLARKAADVTKVYGAAKAEGARQDKFDLQNNLLQGQKEIQQMRGDQGIEQTGLKAALSKAPENEQTKLAARRADEDVRTVQDVDAHIDKFKDLIGLADKAKWNPLNFGLAPDAVNPNGVMLKQAIAGLVLDATGGKLGAGISNADVSFLKEAQVNLERGNKDTAIAQLKSGMERIMSKRDAAYKRMGQTPPDTDMSGVPKSKYDYSPSRRRANGESLPSIDDVLKEFGE